MKEAVRVIMAVDGENGGIHPTLQDLVVPAESSSKTAHQFSNPVNLFGHAEVTPSTSNGKQNATTETRIPLPATNSGGLSAIQAKIEAMEPPDKKPRSYQSLTQATIVLSIICCCWPYNGILLCLVYYISKMAKYRAEEQDYMSARSSGYILLACNIITLVFGGVATFAIFVTVLYYVSRRLNDTINSPDVTTTNNFNDNFY